MAPGSAHDQAVPAGLSLNFSSPCDGHHFENTIGRASLSPKLSNAMRVQSGNPLDVAGCAIKIRQGRTDTPDSSKSKTEPFDYCSDPGARHVRTPDQDRVDVRSAPPLPFKDTDVTRDAGASPEIREATANLSPEVASDEVHGRKAKDSGATQIAVAPRERRLRGRAGHGLVERSRVCSRCKPGPTARPKNSPLGAMSSRHPMSDRSALVVPSGLAAEPSGLVPRALSGVRASCSRLTLDRSA